MTIDDLLSPLTDEALNSLAFNADRAFNNANYDDRHRVFAASLRDGLRAILAPQIAKLQNEEAVELVIFAERPSGINNIVRAGFRTDREAGLVRDEIERNDKKGTTNYKIMTRECAESWLQPLPLPPSPETT